MSQKVLIADDQVEVIEALTKNLSAYGYAVGSSTSPDACLAVVEQEPPDVLLLDIAFTIGGREGIDVCRRVKSHQDASVRAVVVVLLTVHWEIDSVEGFKAGADAFVRRPLDMPALRAQMEKLLQWRDAIYEVACLKAEQSLSAVFAHDLRNAAGGAFWFLEALIELVGLSPLTGELKESITLARRIIQAMRDRGAATGRVRTLENVMDLLKDCVTLKTKQCLKRGISLGIAPFAGIAPEVKIWRWDIVGSLIELVHNAISVFEVCEKEGKPIEHPSILLCLFEPDDKRISIRVDDNGPGIPAHLTGRIFDRGFTMRSDCGGTGLGLWLVRERLTEYGGIIEVANRVPQGASFILTLLKAV